MSRVPPVQAVLVNSRDNVATAVTRLATGQTIIIGTVSTVLRQDIPSGHKFALSEIVEGGDLVKYGEVIGRATMAIHVGGHVHVHNVMSIRLPGPAIDGL